MGPLDKLSGEIDELLDGFMSQAVVGDVNGVGLTQYIFFMFIAIALLLIVIFVFKKKQSESLVPHGFFVNGVEYLIEFTRDDLCKSLLGDTWRKHFPFIAAVFLFVLFNNLLGLVPGCHPGTGTIGVTGSLALCSFVYFVAVGIKRMGVGGYLKSLAPKGVPVPINYLVWLIELFSTFLRLITLAVRLFCNMFAGHVVMATFAVLATLFFEPMVESFSAVTAVQATASIAWVAVLIIIYLVEMLVAVIQAYVFAMLTSVYVQLVEQEADEYDQEKAAKKAAKSTEAAKAPTQA